MQTIYTHYTHAIDAEHERRARGLRAIRAARREAARTAPVTIRTAAEADRGALARLASLDGARPPAGEVVVAARGGELVAAVPLAGGPEIADPFEPTADVVELLRVRAAQLRERDGSARRTGGARHAA
jgi:hypothetical protein